MNTVHTESKKNPVMQKMIKMCRARKNSEYSEDDDEIKKEIEP